MPDVFLPLPGYAMASYRVCTTPESLRTAVATLSQHSHIIFDCEGHTLGEAGGKFSLLNLGVAHEDEQGDESLSIFVIDVLSFQNGGESHLAPVFDILKSDKIFKVMFDCRMDASELLHGHAVQLTNVLDLQLADVVSREKRGEGFDRQLQHLVGFLPRHELSRNPTQYRSVHKLSNMDFAMKEYGIGYTMKREVDHTKWLKRPMDRTSLLYAAEDICKIKQLYDVMAGEGYIDEDTLVRQSAAYMALNSESRPQGGKYKRHGLLPLAIVSRGTGPLVRCQGCERDLPATCFPGGLLRDYMPKKCFVCKAVDKREELFPVRNRRK